MTAHVTAVDERGDLNEAGDPYPVRQFTDERRFAPAVREWSGICGGRSVHDRDRTALARQLYSCGLPNHEIADILGVHWARMNRILAGGPS